MSKPYREYTEQDIYNLKKENDELKKYIDRAGIIGIIKVLKCLDEIEKIVNDYSCECWHACNDEIRQKINEVKGN